MKGSKLLLSFWLATAAFCFLQILFGPGGLTETAKLKDQKVKLEARLTALEDENLRLTARYMALQSSTEAVRLEARSLGYFLPGDVPVRTLVGAEFRLPSDEPDLSVVPSLPESDGTTAGFFRAAWVLLFLVFYAFFQLVDRLRPARDGWDGSVQTAVRNLPVPIQTGLDFFRK